MVIPYLELTGSSLCFQLQAVLLEEAGDNAPVTKQKYSEFNCF